MMAKILGTARDIILAGYLNKIEDLEREDSRACEGDSCSICEQISALSKHFGEIQSEEE